MRSILVGSLLALSVISNASAIYLYTNSVNRLDPGDSIKYAPDIVQNAALDRRHFTQMKVVEVRAPWGPNQVKFTIRKEAPMRERHQGNIVELIIIVAIDNKERELWPGAIRDLAVPAAKEAMREASEALDRHPIGPPY